MASDSFTGVDGTLLTAHDSNWQQMKTVLISNLTLVSNKVQVSSYGIGAARWAGSTSDISEAIMKSATTQPPYSSLSKRVVVRSSSSSEGYAAYLLTLSGNNYTRLTLQKNGSYLADLSTTLSIPSGTDYKMKITAAGTSTVAIKVYINDTLIGTYNDSSSPITSGNPGIKIVGSNILVDNFIDDWNDGVSMASGISRGRSVYDSGSRSRGRI